MKITKRKILNVYSYIVILAIMLSSEAIYEHVYPWWDNSFKVLVAVLGCLSIFIIKRADVRNTLTILIALTIFLCFWTILGGANFVILGTIIAKLYPILLFSLAMKENGIEVFKVIYNVLFVLIIVSLTFFVLFDLGLLGIEPNRYIWQLSNGYQYIYKDYLGIYYRWHRTRSVLGIEMISANGLWHEPGAYQIYANLGLILSLFRFGNEKGARIKSLIFVMAVISSTSTMGLLLTTLIVVIYNTRTISVYKVLLIVISTIAGAVFAVYLLVEKMGTANWSSRMDNYFMILRFILKSPIFGYDIENTPVYSGFLSYFVLFGIVGLIPVIVFLRGVIVNSTFGIHHADKIAITVWYILSMVGENYAYFNVMFLIYGLCIYFKSEDLQYMVGDRKSKFGIKRLHFVI